MDVNTTKYDATHEKLMKEIEAIKTSCLYLAYVGDMTVVVNRKRLVYPIIKIGVSRKIHHHIHSQLKGEFCFARLCYYVADARAQDIETRCKNHNLFKHHRVDVLKSNAVISEECVALRDDFTLEALKEMVHQVIDAISGQNTTDELRMKMLDLEIAKETTRQLDRQLKIQQAARRR